MARINRFATSTPGGDLPAMPTAHSGHRAAARSTATDSGLPPDAVPGESRDAFLRPGRATYWTCQILGWSFAAGCMFLIAATGDEADEPAEALVSALVLGATWLGLSEVVGCFVRRVCGRELSWPKLLARAGMVVAAVASVGALVIAVILLIIASPEDRADAKAHAGTAVMGLTFLFMAVLSLWTAVYLAVRQSIQLVQSRMDRLHLERDAREAELRALKSQLNPHFLFNALNTIKALIEESPEQARGALMHLSRLLRESLRGSHVFTIALEEEWRIVSSYLALEKLRFEERLVLEDRLDRGSFGCAVPSMILLTLVENAIKHGIAMQRSGGTLNVFSFLQDTVAGRVLVLRVSNPGRLDAGAQGEAGHGLKNVREQLHHLYGGRASFSLACAGSTVVSELVVPVEPPAS